MSTTEKAGGSVAHVALAHHVTAVNNTRQQYRDENPPTDYGSKTIRRDQASVLIPTRDPALGVVRTTATQVVVPALPGSAAAQSGTLPGQNAMASSAFSLAAIASVIGKELQPEQEPLKFFDVSAQFMGPYEAPDVRQLRTSNAIEPVLLDLMRRSGCHPPYEGWRIQVTGSMSNAVRNILELLVSGVPLRVECGFPPGAIPLLVDSKDGFIVLKTLEDLLSGWEKSKWGLKGLRKPRLLSIATARASDAHRTSLYDILRKHDIILYEVDSDHYISKQAGRKAVAASRHITTRRMVYLEELRNKTMTELDVDGRVLRFDSLTSATDVNCGLSWITCNPLFYKHLNRIQNDRANSSLGIPDFIMVNTIIANWKGVDGLLDRFITLSDEIATRAAVCMRVVAEHYRLEEEITPGAEPRYRCFSRKSTGPLAREKSVPAASAVLPLIKMYTTSSGMSLIIELQLEAHWKLANLSRSDLEYTRIARSLAHELHGHLMAKLILVLMTYQFQRDLSLYSDAPISKEELETHFLPPRGSRAILLMPNPVGYVVQDRAATAAFGISTTAQPIAEVERSVKRLCEEIEAFFLTT